MTTSATVQWSWSVIRIDLFSEHVVLQWFSVGVVDGPGQVTVGWGFAGEFEVDDGVHPGIVGDLSISQVGLDCVDRNVEMSAISLALSIVGRKRRIAEPVTFIV